MSRRQKRRGADTKERLKKKRIQLWKLGRRQSTPIHPE